MFNGEDESFADMLKGSAKEILGVILLVVFITVISNINEIQRWIENLF